MRNSSIQPQTFSSQSVWISPVYGDRKNTFFVRQDQQEYIGVDHWGGQDDILMTSPDITGGSLLLLASSICMEFQNTWGRLHFFALCCLFVTVNLMPKQVEVLPINHCSCNF